ncbi:putative mitochondrial carrier protein [Trypanosoma conorhini]|uniref:Putative mitochondrial carrier protein n=1 Tax=Trypanosoma conorhini TaxID=83891 RepID=A0A3S5IRV6_9TRYP|nr:putative mitochondrial carrier protein [Trypanosoma conorhini]RNF09048.1 putative mitochondrial carrier protein [Trypanosoma conorhini]
MASDTQEKDDEVTSRVPRVAAETTEHFSWVALTRRVALVGMCVFCASLFYVVFIYLPFFAGGNGQMRLCSATYFCCCFVGGVVSGLPHTLLTPVDLVKCRMQVGEYESVSEGFRTIYRDAGGSLVGSIPLLYRGWVPTLIGYCLQGGAKFFFYEVFKCMLKGHCMVQAVGNSPQSYSYVCELLIYLLASFFAELIADVFLSPWEAIKIKIQTTSVHRTQIGVIVPMVWAAEGCRGFYKGLTALWCRQVPYTVVKFMSFESIAYQLYKVFGSTPQSATSKAVQIFVSLQAGMLAGVLCCIVSHPADTIVSKLNQRIDTVKGTTGTFCHLLRALGWWGIWKGIGPRLLMVGTLTGMQWVLYDSFKVLVGIPTTGGGRVDARNAVPTTGTEVR